MNKPNLIHSMQIPPIRFHNRERYLPTAFDDSLSILEKINRVIQYLYEYSEVTDKMLENWNEVYSWVMNDGLDSMVGDRLREWLDDGTFYRIINETIFTELNNKVDGVIKDFELVKDELDEKFSLISKEINNMIDSLLKEYGILIDEYYMLGETIIYRGE